MLRNYILDGNPCTRDCPDRSPGCNCEKRKAWVAEKNKWKDIIYKDRERNALLDKMTMSKKKKMRMR